MCGVTHAHLEPIYLVPKPVSIDWVFFCHFLQQNSSSLLFFNKKHACPI
jgi:hypothetical protein